VVAARKVRALLFVCGVLVAVMNPPSAPAIPISLSTTSGVMLGWVKEFVYSGSYTVSELDWPLLPAFYAGATLDIGAKSGFLATVDLKLGIPTPVGTMTDSDFLNGDGVKSLFSQSDGNMESAVLLSLQGGWGIPFEFLDGPTGTVEPFLAFEYIRLSWTAQNGYLQYPPETSQPYTPWSSSTPQVPIYGTGIMYVQNYLIPAFGVKGSLSLSQAFSFSASLTFSPYLWCFDKDSHYFTGFDYYDSMQNGILVEPRLSATYRISGASSVTLDVLYRHISSLIGDVTKVTTGAYTGGAASTTFPSAGGASLDVVDITATFTVGL
jgi:outer membrane protease